jgi:class 3 adenylate cyclase
MSSGPEFVVELDEHRNPKTAKRHGREIHLFDENQDFCDLLTWARVQHRKPEEVGTLASIYLSRYFADKAALINFCTVDGTMLAVHHWPMNPEFVTAQPTQTYNITFYPLFQCHTAKGHTIRQLRDGIAAGDEPFLMVTKSVVQELTAELNDENSAARRLSSWPIERSFVYIDVSDFSKYEAGQQALIINTITRLVHYDEFWTADIFKCFEAMLCIGDGYVFVIRDAVQATSFAANLAHVIELIVAKEMVPVEFHFRMGVHSGPVYSFWDPGRKDWNYAGAGINGGNRVLSAIGKETDDVLFVSDAVRSKIIAQGDQTSFYRNLIPNLQNRGRRADKHGKLWRVFEVNHTGVAPIPVALQ